MSALVDLLLVAIGGAAGAASRYLIERYVSQWLPAPFPYGIFMANVIGSFILGVLLAAVDGPGLVLLGVGFCGALTTYSTFAHDTLRLAGSGRRPVAVTNVVMSLIVGLLAMAGGLGVGALIAG